MREGTNKSTRGIVHAAAGQDKFALLRFEPDPRLQPFIIHYWAIRYELPPGVRHTQTVLSYPNVHLAFEQDEAGRRALLYGVPSRPFVRELSGAGHVLGVKFRAGGWYPFWQQEVARLTGTAFPASDAFGFDCEPWLNDVMDAEGPEAMAAEAERVLLGLLPRRDEQAELADRIVEEAMQDREMIRAEQMSERHGLSLRQLQRLFRKYVGVSPKWVIRRFRLQEAAQRLEQDETVHWAELAVQLGYFDQAHFIRDFRSVLGQAPTEYRKKADLR